MRAAQIGHYIAGNYCWSIDLAGGNEMPTTLCRYRVKYASFHSCSQTAKRRPPTTWLNRCEHWPAIIFHCSAAVPTKSLVHCMHQTTTLSVLKDRNLTNVLRLHCMEIFSYAENFTILFIHVNKLSSSTLIFYLVRGLNIEWRSRNIQVTRTITYLQISVDGYFINAVLKPITICCTESIVGMTCKRVFNMHRIVSVVSQSSRQSPVSPNWTVNCCVW